MNGRKEKVEEKVSCMTKEEKTKQIELATLIRGKFKRENYATEK